MAELEIDLECNDSNTLVSQALRAFLVADYANAAAAYGKAIELKVKELGDEDDSLGEIYVKYARALIELSRDEDELFENVPGAKESDSDSEDANGEGTSGTADDASEKTENDSTKENGNHTETETESKSDETDENEKNAKQEEKESQQQDKTVKEETKSDEAKATVAETKKENEEESSKEEITAAAAAATTTTTSQEDGTDEKTDEEQQNGEQDCTDLQVAWEVLEVAKKIFQKRGDAGKELLSETLILLGEIGMESESYDTAINDMKEGLEIQKNLLEQTSRILAETYYKVGIGLASISNITEAIEHFDGSIRILKNRLEHLKKLPNNEGEKEIEEINELIQEITEKINDIKNGRAEMAAQILKEIAARPSRDDTAGTSSSSATTTSTVSSSVKANDISHLVKRKRKADDELESSDVQPPKKISP